MSNIPEARQLIIDAINCVNGGTERWAIAGLLQRALDEMKRKPAVRRARSEPVEITDLTREHIQRLAENPNLTMQQIATMTGVRSSGRVSEVLNGRR